MFRKLRDTFDTEVGILIVIDDQNKFNLFMETLINEKVKYRQLELARHDGLWLITVSMPNNRYSELIKGLRKRRHNLERSNGSDVIHKLIDLDVKSKK